MLPTYLGLSQYPLSWRNSGGEFRPHFSPPVGVLLWVLVHGMFIIKGKESTFVKHTVTENRLPFSDLWTTNLSRTNVSLLIAFTQGWVTVRQMHGDWRQMQLIPRISCLLFLQHFGNSLSVFIYFHKLWIMNCILTQHSCKHAPVGLSLALSVILSWGCSSLPFLCLSSLACLLKGWRSLIVTFSPLLVMGFSCHPSVSAVFLLCSPLFWTQDPASPHCILSWAVALYKAAPCPPNLVHYGATTKTILSGIHGCSSPCYENTVLTAASSKSTLKHS